MFWWSVAFLCVFEAQLEAPVPIPGNVSLLLHHEVVCTWLVLGARIGFITSWGTWNGWIMDLD